MDFGGPSPPLVIWRICRPLVISRILPPAGHLTDVPWNPRPPVAIPGELEGIPEEVSGWNGSELNSERIHVRFSRNRRWNSGGWHRPGEAESGGFWGCRAWSSAGHSPPLVISRIPPVGHLTDVRWNPPRWSSHGSPPLVISRICGGTPGLRSRFRASSRGFPRKFLDGMAQN